MTDAAAEKEPESGKKANSSGKTRQTKVRVGKSARADKSTGAGQAGKGSRTGTTSSGASRGKRLPATANDVPACTEKMGPAAAGRKSTPVIVGVGASAGGLEAFQKFFGAVPKDSGLAFVVIAHLDPSRVSLLPELLQKSTPMPVHQMDDGERVEPNCVYVTVPDHHVALLNGVLHFLDLPTSPVRLPIDAFFRSLAQDQGRDAVGVILSGTGTDGTLGIKALKEAGGLVMVQDEQSAKYNGMPRSAIATGLVDYVLPPAEMPTQLMGYVKAAGHRIVPHVDAPPAPFASAVQKIVVLLRAATGHDFSQYRKNTVCRRVERRMNIHQIHDVSEYVRFLQESEREANVLFKELLIGVTNFFRDPDAFSVLKEKALLDLLRDKPEDYTVRAWVPGCSTGEEAYSISMLLHECARELNRTFGVQVFGTDIDVDAIETARSGVYPANVASDVHPELLKRYFSQANDGSYRISKAMRATLVFAPQNILSDPPFTKLDLVSCRNMLIYFEPELQKKLLPVFHYSLNPDGILFLGASETVSEPTGLFTAVDNKWKVFRPCPASSAAHQALRLPAASIGSQAGTEDDRAADPATPTAQTRPLEAVEAMLSHSDLPPCAAIDHALNIVYLHGRTGKYLEPNIGTPTFNVVEMARPGLREELAAAIHDVQANMQETVRKGLRVAHNGGHVVVDLTVRPVLGRGAGSGLMLVVFEESGTPSKSKAKGAKPTTTRRKGKAVEDLEEALRSTRETLQATVEELQTSNEEFKSTNEELQSTNEELQSTNEELETSKEELQSLNEEAATANAELQSRLDQLGKANDDVKNLLDSTDIAVLFLDTELNVRRFTPRITDFIPLTDADSGRSITHFASSLVDAHLSQCATEVLRTLNSRELEVSSSDGRRLVMRLRPYRTTENVIDGVTITLQDITKVKEALSTAESARTFSEAIVNTVREPLLVLDPEFPVVSANPAFYRTFRTGEKDTVGRDVFSIDKAQWDIPELRRLLGEILPEKATVEEFEVERVLPDGGSRKMVLNARALQQEAGGAGCILLVFGIVQGAPSG